ncbi:bifunctional phosphoglucose/phosphomannose isomerase [candidate division WOR-3 bacterium JGI_Cruoil_03_51_56]|uniref:Bifunctional phosphoglucose/phosphomannose isomerase n=1 Tax=candidate division WOR-3 bacterium JGI_Cruoil_03_51_56 TaxID=1973747 RepID=A0A235BRI0_UNCW3|nr:MAG: bifunctional phosphoglucose/phosphomannose isomerase [candidate division WOR-3 bacterium JGI_Cruoil_03_51_56]
MGSMDSMLDLVLGLPEQIVEAVVISERVNFGRPRSFDKLVVAGMGGSGISGDMVRCLFWGDNTMTVLSCRDYNIPAAVTSRTLFVAISYSGNTEETLTAFHQARRRNCRILAITSGGKLGRAAKRAGVPVITVPDGLPPRAAFGYLFVSLLKSLGKLGVCHSYEHDLAEAVGLMAECRSKWLRKARTVAGALLDQLPVVYSTSRLLDAVAERWRCQLNENAKVMCHTNVFPEHNHNEVVGMGSPDFLAKNTIVVGLIDRSTYGRTMLRLGYALDITRNGYAKFLKLKTEGKSSLARMFSLVMLGDLVSVELARLRGVDPMPVARIDELKRRMAKG